MSFGFSVSDFLGVGTLVWNVYNAYRGAPEQFRNFSQEILSVHVVYKQIEDQLRNQGYGNNSSTLSAKDMDDLKILHDGLQNIMRELDALLQKYQSLTENHSVSFDRLRWGQEDLAGFRERIVMHVGLLTAFNTSLTARHVANQSAQLGEQNASLVQQAAQFVAIQEQLGQIFAGLGLRRRGSVASIDSIVSFALTIGPNSKKAWKDICRELHGNGVTAEMLKAKKEEILKLCRSATATGLTGNRNGELEMRQEGNQARKTVRASLDKVIEILSVPATRARSFVAELSVNRLLDKEGSIDAKNAFGEYAAIHIVAKMGRTDLVEL
ncbi:hypothetical protein L211DRAFT_811319, partial [Terfezia boudieri ATCC MYA-4762]